MNTELLALSDIDKLVPLFDQYMVFYGQPSDQEKYKAYLLERINNKEATVYLALDKESEAIGFVLNYQTFSSVSLGRIVVLNDLFVVPAARQKGVAKALIECSFNLAEETGSVRVDLGTAKTNSNAQALYEQLGFEKDTEYFSYSFSV
jgi:ribosomal protein S18 acetylase RimI-like enzyme|tara:strand:+ start:78 stop:521 length:444 start_codon:yes stop_codon:yes gene_type:complete